MRLRHVLSIASAVLLLPSLGRSQEAPRKALPAEITTSDFLQRCFLPETFARLSGFDEVRELRFTYQPVAFEKTDAADGMNWLADYRFQYAYRKGDAEWKNGESFVKISRLNDNTYLASSLGSRINGKFSGSCSFDPDQK